MPHTECKFFGFPKWLFDVENNHVDVDVGFFQSCFEFAAGIGAGLDSFIISIWNELVTIFDELCD